MGRFWSNAVDNVDYSGKVSKAEVKLVPTFSYGRSIFLSRGAGGLWGRVECVQNLDGNRGGQKLEFLEEISSWYVCATLCVN